MKKKSLIIVIIFFFLQNCGYTPIFSDNKEKKFTLNVIEIEGDDEMNNILSTSLKRYSNKSSEKIYNLKISTDYKKNTLSKNKKGEITNYLIVSKITFEILNNKNNKTYNFEEETKTANITNQFELKKYEKSIKTNFINLKIEELILSLSDLE
tara:strand:- start:369 stop:827 length:459 start_codon:yes stop_codon:yes gene_type:complete